jgi:Ca2+-dependent lipid-binding protein
MKTQKIHVRVYLIQGINLMPKDKNNLADPYVILELGPKKKGEWSLRRV